MRKSLRLFLVLFLSVMGMANVMADPLATWTVGNEKSATLNDPDSKVQETKLVVGTDLTASLYDATTNGGGSLATYQPATGNAGNVTTDMVEYSIKMKKGVKLQLTDVAFDAVKQGTDNAYFTWSYTVDGTESDVVSCVAANILRNNNANKTTASLTHQASITGAAEGRVVTVRFYISNVANNKKMSIGNVKISGTITGKEEVRTFKDFTVDLRQNVTAEELNKALPEGTTLTGGFHDAQHGFFNAQIIVPVDGPVKFTIGGCQYGSGVINIADDKGTINETLSAEKSCDDNTSFEHYSTWTYNVEEPATLTISLPGYCPWFKAEACEYIASAQVRYYDVDGKKIIGEKTVMGGSPLTFAYGAEDVTVADGSKFRGWFNSVQSSAVKVAEGTPVTQDIELYAKATPIENVTNTSRFIYDLTKSNWYAEDHEAISFNNAKPYNSHGWIVSQNGSFSVPVAGKAILVIKNCTYSTTQTAVVTDATGKEVGKFNIIKTGEEGATVDGAESSVTYDGPATTLTCTFPQGAYVHGVTVYNVVDFVKFNEATGFYEIPAGDSNSLLMTLSAANGKGNVKIFLPDATYDLGELVLTNVSGENISIVGQSMDKTIIKNAPSTEIEGIGTTATILNTSNGLYLQDLTLQNALDYYATGAAGRAVCLQDKGRNTICKNVKMLSYQDTYYSNAPSDRYWEDSEIHGTVDYLCGDGNIIFQSCLFVNESREANKSAGSDVLAAPNCTATTPDRPNYGYIFRDCSVKSECNDFSFARSWGGESKAYFINTKILDNSLAASRFTAQVMNNEPAAFKEYNTTDANGNVTTPASNKIDFFETKGTTIVSLETVMTAEEAASLTSEKVFTTWKPEQYTKQSEVTNVLSDGTKLTWNGTSDTYAVFCNDKFVALTVGKSFALTTADADAVWSVRAANARGGFGPAAKASKADAVEEVKAAEANAAFAGKIFNLAGQQVTESYKGTVIKNGVKYIQ